MSQNKRCHNIGRRALLAGTATSFASLLASTIGAAPSPFRLIFVHGRGQEGLDANELKATWIATLRRGAEQIGRTLPDTLDVAFPYYGDTLDRLTREADIPLTSDVHARGSNVDNEF